MIQLIFAILLLLVVLAVLIILYLRKLYFEILEIRVNTKFLLNDKLENETRVNKFIQYKISYYDQLLELAKMKQEFDKHIESGGYKDEKSFLEALTHTKLNTSH